MLYDFICRECGDIREVCCSCDEIVGHREMCCDSRMERVFTAPAITGDLPGRGNVGYYDHVLGAQIVSRKQRRDLMERKGLADHSPTETEARIMKESAYIKKHSGGRREVNMMAKAETDAYRKKRTKEAVSNAVDQALKGVSV